MGKFTPDMTFGPFAIRYYVHNAESGARMLKTANVTVAVDPVAIADLLGPRAARSVRGMSHEAGGRVRVRVVK